MGMACERCGRDVSASEGNYVFYQNGMMFVCNSCAGELKDEIRRAQKICEAVNGKRTQAEHITNDADAFDRFLKSIEETLKKIPHVGNLLSDIPLLVSLVKSFVGGGYREVPYNSIIAVVATLLYVISPIDLIPDFIPGVGFADDAAAVAFCIKMLHDDLEKYKTWRAQRETSTSDVDGV